MDVDAHRELLDDRIAMYGVFVGSEFRCSEMPGLGFNFDIGYRRADYDVPWFGMMR